MPKKNELNIGEISVKNPIILAPMAGITNLPFRKLCRELENEALGNVESLFICEMITARALVEKNPTTLHYMEFDESETIRSMQLYTVDPKTTYEAVRMIVEEDLADHIDMNFGCPVPKVTRKGGGAALPFKQNLFKNIVENAVKATGNSKIPVTVKFRVGIDNENTTYLTAGKIAESVGVSAITLHARTAAERYSGHSDWTKISKLKNTITTIPVMGNGDIFSSKDMQNMFTETDCDGVVIGRGCLGRPWLFAEMRSNLLGKEYKLPNLGKVKKIMVRHAELIDDFDIRENSIVDFRKHASWYLKGFPVGSEIRRRLAGVSSINELKEILNELPDEIELPENNSEPRGRRGSAGKVVLPHNWLADPFENVVPFEADFMNSGG